MSKHKIQGTIALSTLRGDYHLLPSSDLDLIVFVHGKAGNSQVMKIFEKIFSHANYIYPEADIPDPLGGFSWWSQPEKDEFDLATIKITKFVTELVEKFQLRPKRIIACGFSQGGACLSWLSQKEEGFFTHLVMICSFYLESSYDIKKYPSTFIYHGLEDAIVSIDQALEGVTFLTKKSTPVTFVADAQGHKISTKGVRALKDWLAKELI